MQRKLTTTGLASLLALILSYFPIQLVTVEAAEWEIGDVFAAVGNGNYKVFKNDGRFLETLVGPFSRFTTGCSFNPDLTKFYGTYFSNTKVVAFDDIHPHGILQVVNTNAMSPTGHSESVVFDAAGNFYVGHPDGNDLIHKYDVAGNLIVTFAVAVDNRGTDWLDIAADQKTLFYTSEGRAIQRFDTVENIQLENFAVLPGEGLAFALRLLPPWDGSGGLLVADEFNVKRLDSTGNVVQIYDRPNADSWLSLALDPNGTSFWAGTFDVGFELNNDIYRFNIETGDLEVGPIPSGGDLFGLCTKGEPTAGISPLLIPRWMTGGGRVSKQVKHSFRLECPFENVGLLPRQTHQIQVNWVKGNKFHLEILDSLVCSNDSALEDGFDTVKGSGTGRYNSESGATIEFYFSDRGEPGKFDYAEFEIMDVDGNPVQTVSGTLQNGNHQAHEISEIKIP